MTARVRVRVWDLPTRLFHLAMIFCTVGAFLTVKAGTLWMDWHVRFGLALGTLVVFRIIWGLVGPHYARFSQFLKGPGTIRTYLADRGSHLVGHNPLGAWSVILMLVVFGFQAFSGLFTTDDILTSGPLAHLNAFWSARLTNLHKANEWVIIALVAFHVAAVLWYQFAVKTNLIGPMIHGDVTLDRTTSVKGATDTLRVRLWAVVLIALLACGAWWVAGLGSAASGGMDFM